MLLDLCLFSVVADHLLSFETNWQEVRLQTFFFFLVLIFGGLFSSFISHKAGEGIIIMSQQGCAAGQPLCPSVIRMPAVFNIVQGCSQFLPSHPHLFSVNAMLLRTMFYSCSLQSGRLMDRIVLTM